MGDRSVATSLLLSPSGPAAIHHAYYPKYLVHDHDGAMSDLPKLVRVTRLTSASRILTCHIGGTQTQVQVPSDSRRERVFWQRWQDWTWLDGIVQRTSRSVAVYSWSHAHRMTGYSSRHARRFCRDRTLSVWWFLRRFSYRRQSPGTYISF